MTALEFRAMDFGLRVPAPQVRRLTELSKNGGSRETGGVLIGRYSQGHDLALVCCAEGPPSDSAAGAVWFHRGVAGLRSLLSQLWTRPDPTYYLGEWHLHPGSVPTASAEDRSQMLHIANSPRYHCPEPILLILGWDSDHWLFDASVFNRSGDQVPLQKTVGEFPRRLLCSTSC